MPIMMFIGNFSYALVIIVGAALALNGHQYRDYSCLYGLRSYLSQPLSHIP